MKIGNTMIFVALLLVVAGGRTTGQQLPASPWKSYYNFPTGESSSEAIYFSSKKGGVRSECFASNYGKSLEVYNATNGFPIWAHSPNNTVFKLVHPISPSTAGSASSLAVVVGPGTTNYGGASLVNFSFSVKDFCTGETISTIPQVAGKSFINVSNSVAAIDTDDSGTLFLLVASSRNLGNYGGYGNTTFELLAVDTSSGVTKWHWTSPLQVNGSSWSTLRVAHGVVIVTLAGNLVHVMKFDASSGKQLWDCTTGCCAKARLLHPPLIISSSKLLLQANDGGDSPRYRFCLVNTTADSNSSPSAITIWEKTKGYASAFATMAVKGDTIVATANRPNGGINSNENSHIFAFSVLTGENIWNVSFMGTAPILAVPQQDAVLFAYWQTIVYYEWNTGKNYWNWTAIESEYSGKQIETLGVSPDGKQVAAWAQAGAYTSGNNKVYYGESNPPPFSPESSPSSTWCADIGGNQAGQTFEPAVDGDTVFQCGYSKLYALSKKNGSKLWSFAGGPIDLVEKSRTAKQQQGSDRISDRRQIQRLGGLPRVGEGYPSQQLYPLMSPLLTGNDTVTVTWLLGLAGTGPLNSQGEVYALNRKTGDIVWQLKKAGGDLDTPVSIDTTPDHRYLLVTQYFSHGQEVTVYDTNKGFSTLWTRHNVSVLQVLPTSMIYLQDSVSGVITLLELTTQRVQWNCSTKLCTTSRYFVVYPDDLSMFLTYNNVQQGFASQALSMVSTTTYEVIWQTFASNGFGSISVTNQFVSFWAHNSYNVLMRKTGLFARYIGVSYGWNGAVGAVVNGTTLYGGSSALFALDLVRNQIKWRTDNGIWGSLSQTPYVIQDNGSGIVGETTTVYAFWDTRFCRYDV